MTKREALMKKLSTYQFAAHDVQLYLDTHPEDKSAIKQAQRFQQLAAPLAEQYEQQYGALTKREADGNNWNWIKGPWPWENEEDC